MAEADVRRLVRDTDLVALIADVCGARPERAGDQHRVCCPWHRETSPSCYIYQSTGDKPTHYHCHACGAHGDAIKVLTDKGGKTYEQALVELARRLNWWPAGLTPDGFDRPKKAPKDRTEWTPIVPVPDKALPYVKPQAFTDWKGRTPTRVHQYLVGGKLWGVCCRYVTPADEAAKQKARKDTPIWTWCRAGDDGREEWRQRRWEAPLPLYGLERLDGSEYVVIHEGEGKCDDVHARRLFIHRAANLSWCGGCKAARKADWTPLRGRTVYLAPDCDAPGLGAQVDVASILHSLDCKVHLIQPATYAAILGDALTGLVAEAEAEAQKWGEPVEKWVWQHESGTRFPAGWDLGNAPATWGEAEASRILAEAVLVSPKIEPLLADTDDQQALDATCAKLPLTAIGFAQRLVARYGRDLRFDWSRRAWMVWVGTHWTIDKTGVADRCAMDTATRVSLEAPNREPHVKLEDYQGFAFKCTGRTAREHCLKDAAAMDGISIADRRLFDANPWLLATPGSTINLRTGERQPPRREDLLTSCARVDYDAAARHPIVERVLRSITGGNQDIADYLQLALGASVVCGNLGEKLYCLITWGGSGKTSLWEGISAVLTEDHVAAIAQATLLSSSQDKIRSDLARLDGKRMVYCDDLKAGVQLDEWLIKWITGGGTIVARFLNANEMSFKARFTPWLLANEPPRIKGDDSGVRRRLVMIDLRQVVPANNPLDQDASIKAAMTNPSACGQAILAWLIEGTKRYAALGACGRIPLPPRLAAITESYLEEQDAQGEFFHDYLRRSSNTAIPAAELRATYATWCELEEVAPLGKVRFGQRLRELGATPVVRKNNGVNVKCWDGLAFTDAATALPTLPTNPAGSEGHESHGARARAVRRQEASRARTRAPCGSHTYESSEKEGSQGSGDESPPPESNGLDIPSDDLAGF